MPDLIPPMRADMLRSFPLPGTVISLLKVFLAAFRFLLERS